MIGKKSLTRLREASWDTEDALKSDQCKNRRATGPLPDSYVQEFTIESCFPTDASTEEFCRGLADSNAGK